MSQFGSYGPRGRAEQRKKNRSNRSNFFINGAIVVVIIAIVFVAGMLIFGGDDSETATGNNEDENNAVNLGNDEHEGNEENEANENNHGNLNEENDQVTEEDDRPVIDNSDENEQGSGQDETNDGASNEKVEDESDPDFPTRGFWKPIGTEQSEPFAAVYERDHINWQEMTRALQYATGLGDEMILWRIGNGGDHRSAEAYVSNSANADTPFKVRIEWVTNEGWMPVSVEKQTENPYRTPPANTSGEDAGSDNNRE